MEVMEHKPKRTSRVTLKHRKFGRWFLGETLGKGGYSWVKKGYDRKDGSVIALKFTSKANNDWSASQSKQVQNQLETLGQIKDEHVLQLLEYNLNAKYPQKDGSIIPSVLLVLEYLPGGELFDILYFTSALSERIARTYFKQLISGLETFHQVGICHRDIKPQNLLLDANFQLKIADFGVNKVFETDNNVGTRGYQAPEILKKKEYTPACDVFSCGVVLFILLAGYPPFECASPKCKWYSPLANGNARTFWKQHRGCGIPGAAKDLITRMIWYDFNKRISIKGIKKHKWYNSESLSSKDLTGELRELHRLMEIKRMEDAEKQKYLHDSSHCCCCMTRLIKMWNQHRIVSATEREIQESLDVESGHWSRREEYWQGDVVKDVYDIYEAYLRVEHEYQVKMDVLNVLNSVKSAELYNKRENTICNNKLVESVVNVLHYYPFRYDEYELIVYGFCRKYYLNKYFNTRIYQFPDGVTRLIWMLLLVKNEAVEELIQKHGVKSMYIEVWFCDEYIKSIAPQLPPHECVTLKDIYTTEKPRTVLQYIQKRIIELGGTANNDLKNASLEAHLCTHNFPAPVTIQVRILEDMEKGCYLVKFERIGGDILHFGRVLKQLIRKCGAVLSGLPKHLFCVSEHDRMEAEKYFGDNQLIQ